MPSEKFTIKIESILGGHSPSSHFSGKDQFRTSMGIDPSLSLADGLASSYASWRPCGLIRPSGVSCIGTTVGAPLWIAGNTKLEDTAYVYDSAGSVYTIDDQLTGVTGLGDLNDGGAANGNGMAYYDNYIYFSRATTVARYGPLNGSPAFIDDYWVTTLSKTKFEEGDGTGFGTYYPYDIVLNQRYPNHFLHRHSDGKLYIADVVGNAGTIHYIKTTKTTVEGDTDNGSTFNALDFGTGLWPIAMESYGSDLVIAFLEMAASTDGVTFRAVQSKLAFWDTTSANYNKITWVEFPDQMITSVKNVNGILYVTSGNHQTYGFRIVRFLGGYSFEEVEVVEDAISPFPGATDAIMNNLFMGSHTKSPEVAGAVFSKGLKKGGLGNGMFNIAGVYGKDASGNYTKTDVLVTALKSIDSSGFKILSNPVIGFTGSGDNSKGIGKFGSYGNAPSIFWSGMYRLGQPFKIQKIRIPLGQAVGANMTITVKVYTDDGNGPTYTLQTIDSTNYNGVYNVILRSDASGQPILGQHNFWIELRITGSALAVVGLPLVIEGEYIND